MSLFDERELVSPFKEGERPEVKVIVPEIDMHIPWLDTVKPYKKPTSLFAEEEAEVGITKSVHLVIDADSLVYQAAHIGRRNIEREDSVFGTNNLFDEQYSVLLSRLADVKDTTAEFLRAKGIDIEKTTLLFTPRAGYRAKHALKPNFRYALVQEYNKEETAVYDAVNAHREEGSKLIFTPLPGYKAGRVGAKRPPNVEALLEKALDELENTIASDGCEADDYAYRMKVDDPENVVIACIDKDILPGTPTGSVGHVNFNRREMVYTSEDEAKRFYYIQCMMGDSSDGIPGIYGCGIVKASKVIPKWKSHEDAWRRTLDKFTKEGYTEEYAVLMMRLVNLSQFDGETVNLWHPPVLEAE